MMLVADNLHKFYGAFPALNGLSFSVEPGETVGFLGVNGAGKSTAMRILTGFFAPTSGAARIDGRDPMLPETRRSFGYLPENNPLPARMRVGEYLSFRAGLKGLSGAKAREAVKTAARACRIDAIKGSLISSLSKGYRQRVGLAESILSRPPALILDEPTSGLDPAQAEEARELIRELGRDTTILLSSHILHDVETLCRRVVIIDEGRVVADDSVETISAANVEERTIALEILASEPVREALRGVPGIKSIAIAEGAGGEAPYSVRVTMPPGVDLRREIAALASRRGWLVTEMHLEPARLEDIFRVLARAGRMGRLHGEKDAD
ncbi:MAG: ABC transporter ATP-binding protein [Planctomycetota bacterium]|nr:ABC transporter ATP-binding protein [Planctomycetota bacterium]